jgi:hypothetical protein
MQAFGPISVKIAATLSIWGQFVRNKIDHVAKDDNLISVKSHF